MPGSPKPRCVRRSITLLGHHVGAQARRPGRRAGDLGGTPVVALGGLVVLEFQIGIPAGLDRQPPFVRVPLDAAVEKPDGELGIAHVRRHDESAYDEKMSNLTCTRVAQSLAWQAGSGLSKYDMPEWFVALDAFPLTASGKILKRELVEMCKRGELRPEPVRYPGGTRS